MKKQNNNFYECCVECNGSRFINLNNPPVYSYPRSYPCPLCKGSGVIYWVDKIKGVRNKKISNGIYGVLRKENGIWYYNNV